MAPKKIQTLLQFPGQTVSRVEEAVRPTQLPNSQDTRRVAKHSEDELYDRLRLLQKLEESGHAVDGGLFDDTMKKIATVIGKQRKRPRETTTALTAPSVRKKIRRIASL